MVQAKGSIAIVANVNKFRENWSSDDVLDKLDEQGASDERMVDLSKEEARTFASQTLADYPGADHCEDMFAITASARQSAMWLLGHLIEYAGLPEVYLLKAGLFLDILSSKKSGALLNSSIPAVCVALVKIIKKVETAAPDSQLLGLQGHASYLVGWLQECGWHQAYAEPGSVDRETEILDALDWKMELPTIQDWITLSCTRLNVFMFGLLAPVLNQMWERSFYLARTLAVSCPANEQFLPRRVGQGLLCLNLVLGRILPASAFKLEFSTLACAYWDDKPDMKKHFKPESVELVLQSLELATCSDRKTLREDVHLVNETLLALQCDSYMEENVDNKGTWSEKLDKGTWSDKDGKEKTSGYTETSI